MSKLSRARSQTNNWKRKAIERGDKYRYEEREKQRVIKERNQYKNENRKLKKQLAERAGKNNQLTVENKIDLVYVSLQLFLVVGIGFRAVSRVLKFLAPYLGLKKTPCPQTIINWVNRLSISRIHNAPQLQSSGILRGDPFSNGFIWMIDVSIGLGAGKILTVLALDAHHHKIQARAPTLSDVYCIAVGVRNSWTGEIIADFLQKVIGVMGRPTGFLKDGGTDLKRAVQLLADRNMPSVCIDDISHKIANILKREYAEHPLYSKFVSACGQASKRLKQTLLACLAPPKVSTKARFMNLHKLVRWADKILRYSKPGRSIKNSMHAKLRESLKDLPECRAFIQRFKRDAMALLECQKILKTGGLNVETDTECRKVIEGIPPRSPVRKEFIQWLDAHLTISKKLGLEQTGLPSSTDTIESLFGIGKVRGTGEVKDALQIAGRLPALTGPLTREEAQGVLEVSVKEQRETLGMGSSLTKQRREIFEREGSLESLHDDLDQWFELIPTTKNSAKNVVSPQFIRALDNKRSPPRSGVEIDHDDGNIVVSGKDSRT